MSREEIEDFWCAPDPPVSAVYFDDAAGFRAYFVLMHNGSISVHVDSAAECGVQVLQQAIEYFRAN